MTTETEQLFSAEDGLNSPLILVSEDNVLNRETMVDFLRFSNYRAISASDGAEAIKRTDAESPDLILMDMKMPGVDGLTAIRHIRASGNTVPIIALTGQAMVEDKAKCLDAGADGYLAKPVRIAELIKTIQSYLDLQAAAV